MEAILACHPARSTEWLDCHPKSYELWRIRTGPILAFHLEKGKSPIHASFPQLTHDVTRVCLLTGAQSLETLQEMKTSYHRLCPRVSSVSGANIFDTLGSYDEVLCHFIPFQLHEPFSNEHLGLAEKKTKRKQPVSTAQKMHNCLQQKYCFTIDCQIAYAQPLQLDFWYPGYRERVIHWPTYTLFVHSWTKWEWLFHLSCYDQIIVIV